MVMTGELIREEEIEWIRRYIEMAVPSGNESDGQKMWADYMKPYADDFLVDNYGNVAAIINPGHEFKVVIEAHADEIAWYVQSISSEGFIHVAKTGGTDPGIAPSQRVYIHTDNGPVEAIFGWPAIHTRNKSSEIEAKESNIFIDCGCASKKEVEALGIQVGDLITYQCTFSVLNEKYFVGRAQDNRMGGFIIATVARLLKENSITLPYSLYVVNAVQEEVGLRGAEMIAHTIKPDCTIITDAKHATHTPLINKNVEGDIDLAKGPTIVKAPSVHTVLRKLLQEAARENDIPYQLGVSSKKTGTDTDAFAYTNGGIPSCLVSLPLRYMHTTVETSHKEDIENSIRLIYYTLQKITPDLNLKYFEV
jgi:putative aminopeptidase FrvX